MKIPVILFSFLFCLFCSPVRIPAQAGSDRLSDLRSRKTGDDWPAFLGQYGDGKSSETGVMTSWPESGAPVRWHETAGEGYGAPSISKGRLLLFDRVGNLARLRCLLSENGKELWRFEYSTDYEDLYGFSNGPRAVPVIDDERVYIFGVEGMLYCLNILDGRELWRVDTATRFGVIQNFFGVGSSPVVENELLIVPVGGSPPMEAADILEANGNVSGNSTGVVAFHKLTGEVVYKTSDELASYASPVLATINDRRWCFVFARGGLFGFDPANGKVDFHYPWRSKKLESVNAASPVVAGDLVFISESYGPGSSVLRVRPGGCDIVWKDEKRQRDKAMLLHWNTAIHHEGYLYACSGMSAAAANLRCVNLANGEVAWSYDVKERSSLLFFDDHLVSLGERGTVILLKANPADAEILFSGKIKDTDGRNLVEYPAWSAPVLSNGFLYLRGKDRIVCLDLIKD